MTKSSPNSRKRDPQSAPIIPERARRRLSRGLYNRTKLRTIRVGAYDRDLFSPLDSYNSQLKRIRELERLVRAFSRSLDRHGSSPTERLCLKRIAQLIEDILA